MSTLFIIAATQIFALATGSRLWIEGDSSLHPWSCEASSPAADIHVDTQSPQLVRALTLRVAVAQIECGNESMNGKLREALHAQQHPFIEYRLTQAERVPGNKLRLEAMGDLSINGKTRPAVFQVDVALAPDGTAQANGSIVMLMSDFQVEPPTAMLGLIKTADQITVKFTVHTLARGSAHATLP